VRDGAWGVVRAVIPSREKTKEQSMKCVNKLAAGALLLGQTFCSAAFAVTLAGNTVDYSFDVTQLGLFGQARVSGDTLYFTPVGFDAKSFNGSGFALANATMNIEVTAHDGWSFAGMGLTERGDYLLLGAGSTAAVSGQIRAFDIAHPLADLTAGISASTPLDLAGLPTRNWQADAALDLSAWHDARTVNVTVQNLLLASTSAASSLAFVEKKFVGLTPFTVAVTPVPEAETWTMMLAGLGLMGWATLRRRATSK
jgi:hypothetical protein